MKDLKPFTPAGKIECPKCLTNYMELKLYHDQEGSEYIEVTCGCCGYTWNMETADSGKKGVILECKDEIAVTGSKVKLVDEKSALSLLKENEQVLKEGMGKVEDEDTKPAPVEEK